MNLKDMPRTPPRDSGLYIAKRSMQNGCGMHGHDVFEIDLIVSGSAKSSINGREYELGKHSLIFLTPMDFHDYRTVGEEPVITYNIIFATETMHKHVWSEIPLACQVSSIDDDTYIGLCKICACMLDEYAKSPTDSENILRSGIEWILLMLARAARSAGRSQEPKDKGIAAVLAYIFDNFTDTISREQAAEIMHVSPMHFSKSFHAKMGVSFQQYLLGLRLDYARRLLTTMDMPVSQAAEAAGFRSVNYFSSAFTKKYGISPGKYALQSRRAHMQ